MADIAASVLTRLKNKAQASGRSYQLCLQLFCQEEFLRRLEKSKYAENFVLKGGLFIYSLTEFDSRVTVDVDFLHSSFLFCDRLLSVFRCIFLVLRQTIRDRFSLSARYSNQCSNAF